MKGRRSARKFRGHNLGTASRNQHHCSSYDALAGTINGLYKTELIRPRKPWRAIEAVELATAEWVDWFNHRRLYEYCGDIPPVELERAYYAQTRRPAAG
jgi:putative transposase